MPKGLCCRSSRTDAFTRRLASSIPQFAAKLFAHLIHRRAVARGRQVPWPGRFATERTGSVLARPLRMRDRAKRLGRGAWRLRSRRGGG